MARVYLGLGSNLGDRVAHLERGLHHLAGSGMRVVAMSGVWETEPVGGPQQGPYLNMVAEVETELDPLEILDRAQAAESAAARVRAQRWGPRTLDIDILLVDSQTVDQPRLQVPHPRMWERRFVLAPLRELAPDLVSPEAVQAATGAVQRVGDLDQLPGSTGA